MRAIAVKLYWGTSSCVTSLIHIATRSVNTFEKASRNSCIWKETFMWILSKHHVKHTHLPPITTSIQKSRRVTLRTRREMQILLNVLIMLGNRVNASLPHYQTSGGLKWASPYQIKAKKIHISISSNSECFSPCSKTKSLYIGKYI